MDGRGKRVPSLVAAIWIGAAGVALSGCCWGTTCGPCLPALTLQISDADSGQSVSGVSIEGAAYGCGEQPDLGYTECDVELPVGSFELVVKATGYEDTIVAVTINPQSGDDCCECGYNSRRITVALEPS